MFDSDSEEAAVDAYVDLLIKQRQEDRAFARMRGNAPDSNGLTRMAYEALWKTDQAIRSGDLGMAHKHAADAHAATMELLSDLRPRW